MSRIIVDVNGNDVTGSVQAFVRTNHVLYTANLYLFICMNFWHFNPDGNYVYWPFTDADFPIFINKIQTQAMGVSQLGTWSSGVLQNNGLTFVPEKFSAGKTDYTVGFRNQDKEITWYIDDSKDYTPVGTGNLLSGAASPTKLTLKKAMLLGAFSDVPFWCHRAIFNGDPRTGGALLGTTLMYRGFIRKVIANAAWMKITIGSLLDLFQTVQIPTQVIQPGPRSGPYFPVADAPSGLGTLLGGLPVAFVSPTVYQYDVHTAQTQDSLRDCWATFMPFSFTVGHPWIPTSALPPPPSWRISGNDAGGPGNINVYFYEPPVFPVSAQAATNNINGQQPLSGGAGAGFPDVPPPELSL